MTTSSPTREKADRLIREKRVHYQFTTPDAGRVFWVDGDSGRTRVVTIDGEGFTTCDCPAMIAACAHVLAVIDVAQVPGAQAALSPDLRLEDIPKPGEPADEHGHTDFPPPRDKHPDPALITTLEGGHRHDVDEGEDEPDDDDTDEVPVVGDAGPVPVQYQSGGRDLIDLATAPVTWNTLREIARTDFVPASLRGKPTACLAAILTGRELGLGPMTSLRHIAVIDGSPTLSAELMLNLYRQAGHKLEVNQADGQAVTLTGTRGDTDETLTVTFTIDDAVRGGLVEVDSNGEVRARSRSNKPLPWESYTPDLLWARAVTRLVRRLAPDLRGNELVSP